MKKSEDIEVFIPEESYQILEFTQDNLPGIAVVNIELNNENLKKVFSWNCSILIDLIEVSDYGIPTQNELKIIEEFEEYLDDKIKGADKKKPNALFFGRVTWNSTRQLIWKVYSPKTINDFLIDFIENEKYPREFDYCIEEDENWQLTEWYLKNC